jgi:hypothetical protein
MASPLTFHEGQACDAVLRRIEERENGKRCDLRLHDHDGANAAIELTCKINGKLFAFEHSGIEPFEGHMQLEAQAEKYLAPIENQVVGLLPPEDRFDLHLPFDAMLGRSGREIASIHRAIVEWVAKTAWSLQAAPSGRRAVPAVADSQHGIPFRVLLSRRKADGLPGKFVIYHVAPEDTETHRVARVRRAYTKKCPKLAVWKARGARSVLILEENDILITRHDLVFDAVEQVEIGWPNKPDEIWLVSTAINAAWTVWWLRIDENYCADMSYWGSSISDAKPCDLINLTGK